jgi:hypothetical protein
VSAPKGLQAWIRADGCLESRNGGTRPDFDSLLVFQITSVKVVCKKGQLKHIVASVDEEQIAFQNISLMLADLGYQLLKPERYNEKSQT